MQTRSVPWIFLLLLTSADALAAGSKSQESLSTPAATSDKQTQRVTTPRGRVEQSPAPTASKQLTSKDIAVQTGGAPIKLIGLPEQSLEIPFCRTAEFQFETTGGWGQISGWVDAKKVNTNSNAVPVTTIGAGKWKIEKIETSGGGNPQNASGSGIAQPGVIPGFEDGPAARTRFRVQLTQGVRPDYYQNGFGNGVDTHYARVTLHIRDTNGKKVSETVKATHKIGPDTVRGIAVLQQREYISSAGYKSQGWFIQGQANYIGCGGREVPVGLLSMEMRSASGKTWTTSGYQERVTGELTKSGVDVRFRVGGRTASPWFSAERRRNVIKVSS